MRGKIINKYFSGGTFYTTTCPPHSHLASYTYVILRTSTCCHLHMLLVFVSCYVGAPYVTNLTFAFDGVSRTLTCTSTGGPATNVTWRRDGAVITPNTTYQQIQIVTDATAGTHQTVLTLAKSAGEYDSNYSCSVQNIRGTSNSMQILVYGTYMTMLHIVGNFCTGFIFISRGPFVKNKTTKFFLHMASHLSKFWFHNFSL